MLEKAKIYPEFESIPQRHHLDHFNNPYLAKLNIKMTPRPITKGASYQLIHPLSSSHNVFLSHSIPVYKTEKFRFALLWRQYMTTKFARSHFGISLEHKLLQNYRLKMQLMTGTTSIVNAEFSKMLKNHYELFLGYSGFLEASHMYNTVSAGIRKGLYSLVLSQKVGDETQFKAGGYRQLYDGINIGVSLTGNMLQPEKLEADIALNQEINSKTSASLSIGYNPFYKEYGIKCTYERALTKTEKGLICAEYNERGTILYLGFKNVNFNFILPCLAVDGPLPLIIGAIGFGLSYLYRRKHPNDKVQDQNDSNAVKKTESDRQDELKLIGDKSADIYEKQRQKPDGLLIEEAYIGPPDDLHKFMNDPERFRLLLRSEEHKKQYIDLTVTFRFYVSKGELNLRKGSKNRLLGFYQDQKTHTMIGIRYSRNGNSQIKFFNAQDPISIKKQE